MKCKYCGKDLMDGAKFCVYCGKPIEEEQPVQQIEPTNVQKEEQKIAFQQPMPQIPIQDNSIQEPAKEGQEENTIIENVVPDSISNIDANTQQQQMPSFNVNEEPMEEIKQEPTIVDIVTPAPVIETINNNDVENEKQITEQNVPTPIELPKEEAKNNIQQEVVTKIVKKNNPILIVIIFILLAIIIGGGIFVYTKYIANNTSNSNSKKQSDVDKVTEVKDEKEDEELDLTKSLNTENINYANATDLEGDYGLTMNINPDKKSITLNIDWTKFGPLSTATTYAGNEEYQIAGFSKEISDTFIGSLGQDSMGITLFYLMNDGTVEYTPMFVQRQDTQGNTQYETNFSYDIISNELIS